MSSPETVEAEGALKSSRETVGAEGTPPRTDPTWEACGERDSMETREQDGK